MKTPLLHVGTQFINPAYIVAIDESPDMPGSVRVWLAGNVYDYLDFSGDEAKALLAWAVRHSDAADVAPGQPQVTCCRCGDRIPQSDAVSAAGYAQQLTAIGVNHAVGDADVLCKQCNAIRLR